MEKPDNHTVQKFNAAFHHYIEARNWYAAAAILLQWTNTREDPQDWLSHGDIDYITSKTIIELAAEWDNLN